jgi:flagellar biosynthetic protein FliO
MEVQPSVWSGFGSSLAMSLASLGLVCMVAWAALRWLGRRWGGNQNEGGLRVLARLGLEPRRTLYVVQAGPRRFLIGSGEGGVSLLAELAESDIAVSPEPILPRAFEGWLGRSGRLRKTGEKTGAKTGEKPGEKTAGMTEETGEGTGRKRGEKAGNGSSRVTEPNAQGFGASPPDMSVELAGGPTSGGSAR